MKFYSIRSTMNRESKDTPEEIADVIVLPDAEEGAVRNEGKESSSAVLPLWKRSVREIRNLVCEFNESNGEYRGVVVPLDASCDTYVVIMQNNADSPLDLLNEMLGNVCADGCEKSPIITEITFLKVENALNRAEAHETISDDMELLALVGLSQFRRMRMSGNDRIVEKEMNREEIYRVTEEENLGKDFRSELDRIYTCAENAAPFRGHPVHYMMVAESGDYRRTLTRTLISALYDAGRLTSKRYTVYAITDESIPDELEAIYRMNKGATVLIRFAEGMLFSEGQTQSRSGVETFLKIVRKNMANTLTLFNFCEMTDGERDAFRDKLGPIAIAEFRPDVFVGDDALCYVERLAVKDGFTLDDEMKDKLKATEAGYLADALDVLYSEWRNRHISTVIYPQYRNCFAYGSVRTEKKDERSALDELNELIGLSQVKKTVKDALNYFKLQQEYRMRGLAFTKPNMHMVFTGNPGTAKTTVARLVSRIFRENGLLSIGDLIEVGRSDIVEKYVGHTAKNVKQIFERAKGSVLFIDEAYSLVDDKKGMFGDEAINTIVQLMENYRNDIVVIFAGYTKEMNAFLSTNPGLRSRISFHIDFNDYSEEELCDITELLAKKDGTTFQSGVRDVLRGVFREEMRHEAFGNGRLARSLFEHAKIHLGERFSSRDLSTLSNAELTTLTPEDFLAGRSAESSENRSFRIGFGA